jgi:hypothetical protein
MTTANRYGLTVPPSREISKNYTPEPLGNIIDEGKSGVIYFLPVNAEKRIPVLSDTIQLLDQSSLGLT